LNSVITRRQFADGGRHQRLRCMPAPLGQLTCLALKPDRAVSGARILPHQLAISIPLPRI
jgi:hypothetical protein